MSAANARSALAVLLAEREAALRTPLSANRAYMADLEADIGASRAALVGWAVTERAVQRAARAGRLQG